MHRPDGGSACRGFGASSLGHRAGSSAPACCWSGWRPCNVAAGSDRSISGAGGAAVIPFGRGPAGSREGPGPSGRRDGRPGGPGFDYDLAAVEAVFLASGERRRSGRAERRPATVAESVDALIPRRLRRGRDRGGHRYGRRLGQMPSGTVVSFRSHSKGLLANPSPSRHERTSNELAPSLLELRHRLVDAIRLEVPRVE